MKKKIISIFLIICLLAVTYFSVGADSNDDTTLFESNKPLQLWYTDEALTNYVESAAFDYQEEFMEEGVKNYAMKGIKLDEKAMGRTEAIILSMTKKERNNPDIINGSRRKRIADGAGLPVEEVNKLLKQFDQTRKLMKQFANPKQFSRMGKRKMKIPFN